MHDGSISRDCEDSLELPLKLHGPGVRDEIDFSPVSVLRRGVFVSAEGSAISHQVHDEVVPGSGCLARGIGLEYAGDVGIRSARLVLPSIIDMTGEFSEKAVFAFPILVLVHAALAPELLLARNNGLERAHSARFIGMPSTAPKTAAGRRQDDQGEGQKKCVRLHDRPPLESVWGDCSILGRSGGG